MIDILIAGVGGQGTILTSRLLAECAVIKGIFARTGETIGMSQRGGCVVSHVRLESEEASGYVPYGSADLMIAFEMAEGARNISRLKKGGKAIVNTQCIKPVTVTVGGMPYDMESIQATLGEAIFIDGYGLAKQAGNAKAVNVVLLGAAISTGLLPFTLDEMKDAIRHVVKESFWEVNFKALEMGYQDVGKAAKCI